MPFILSRIPQATLQNLTHFGLYLTGLPCDEPYWKPLRSTSLQYLYFQWTKYLREECIDIIRAAFQQRPPSLKALILSLYYDYHHFEGYLDELDTWFCKNQNNPNSSVVILAGLFSRTVDGGMQPVIESRTGGHKVWGSWAFLTHIPPSGLRYYDLCEEMLPDGKLTIWEEADRALEERRLRLASQVNAATQE
jgi:hypothetical protein